MPVFVVIVCVSLTMCAVIEMDLACNTSEFLCTIFLSLPLCWVYHSQEVKVKLNSVPPPKALEKALAARFIMTMASSSPDQPDLQFFFFAKHVRREKTCYTTHSLRFL